MSSAEAELCGTLTGTMEVLGIRSVGLGLRVTLSMHTDSAAAVGICERTGMEEVTHLTVATVGPRRSAARRLSIVPSQR